MNELSMVYGMGLAALLFLLGFIGVVIRRNTLFVLMCLEIMINAAGLAFIVAGARWSSPDGNTMFILIIAVAAAEAAIGLAILVCFFRNRGTIAVEDVNMMKG